MNIGANRNAHDKLTVSTKQPQTWQLGFQTLERYWASFQVTRLFHSATTNFFNQVDYYNEDFFIFFLWGVGVGGGGAQLQCIYYLLLYTDLKAAEDF